MWSEISKLIGANPIMTLVIIIVGTSTIWMYKEFKEMINQNNKSKISNINEKIKVYSKLQASAASLFYNKELSDLHRILMNQIGEFSPLLSEDVRRVVRDYFKYGDYAYLETMLAFIEVDLKKFEDDKRKLSKYENSTDIADFVNKLYDPLKPILLIWLLIWFMFMSYSVFISQDAWYSKLFVIVSSISIFISVISLIAIISLKIDKGMGKESLLKWFVIGYIVLSPVFVFIYEGLSIFSLVTQIIGFYLLASLQKSKKKMIITLD
ncbi:hypothetical protein P4H39_14680 [Paenibacillus lautus]|uniref:hypothetical protein n=1 Tax=Paenibacillus lautus TaxID=1401 RepID=UPI002DB70051|nr:hypothetical protein [Paenibacillus lautus]MEC0203886.1 hypothetical protein [Paenibacillus lautus]